MNSYFHEKLARERADALLADAAAGRLAREARQARRLANREAGRPRTAHAVFAHPLATVHAWLVSGQL